MGKEGFSVEIKEIALTENCWGDIQKPKWMERVSCTYPITVKNEAYVWALYHAKRGTLLKGLCLYNVTTGKKIEDESVQYDFLKLLYAYSILMRSSYREAMRVHLDLLEKQKRLRDLNIKKKELQMKVLEKLIPDFVAEAWDSIFDLLHEMAARWDEMIEIIQKHRAFVLEFGKDRRKPISGKWLACILSDLYRIYQLEEELKNLASEREEEIELAMSYFEIMGGNMLIHEIMDFVKHEIQLNVSNPMLKSPLVQNMISQDFSDSIIDPYVILLR